MKHLQRQENRSLKSNVSSPDFDNHWTLLTIVPTSLSADEAFPMKSAAEEQHHNAQENGPTNNETGALPFRVIEIRSHARRRRESWRVEVARQISPIPGQ